MTTVYIVFLEFIVFVSLGLSYNKYMLIYFLLIVFYAVVPPLLLYKSLRDIYQKKDKYGWHTNYLYKYIITLSFLPVLFLKGIDLGLTPKSPFSIGLIILTAVLVLVFYEKAKNEKVVQFYNGGVEASVMEEILYRGIIFGLFNSLIYSTWISLVVSSLLFGLWHFKNIPWMGRRDAFKQFLYSGLYAGPIFCLLRIWTGDLYLAIFVHFLWDTTVALAPQWTRDRKLVLFPKPIDKWF